ncbi:hypothetical protein K6U06_17975 [Acidiferrimicrobium sp. IK]|uniref:hypothetical protein n=1 Tax=Acidiferrimicrobium sp. IK TaxID=2871700 RepID=UPI0021CB27ED|nr:hypothetical protein [Acidiferrimicrobium sp. IK]MCU4186259.1 hypothetical protein [Acidiferrimicrobium sp. IK]
MPEKAVPTPERVCGRCRKSFAGDPTLSFQTGWALCPECTEVLLPVPMGAADASSRAGT